MQLSAPIEVMDVFRGTLCVKMFQHNSAIDCEKALASWLDKNDVHISHVTQSQSEKGGAFLFVITIFYRSLH